MEWFTDPNAWMGLVALIFLEIVLGIDNLVFIAILAEKLPAGRRQNHACMIGLICALLMRLVVLSLVSWAASLTKPLFSVFFFSFSIRDIIMITGGAFLLAKGTLELHERLEGVEDTYENDRTARAVFWQVIAQIIVLDAVFSIDSIITAVGMVQHIAVMIAAVIIAMSVMILASGSLMIFINQHPTIVILCLGFLMMIGFSLIVEGLGFHIPKGYLYAAIGFSILIEIFNQISRHKREKRMTKNDIRSRTAGVVLRLLRGKRGDETLSKTVEVITDQTAGADVFHPEEKKMIRSVLDLAERPVRSIMSPRHEVEWLDLSRSGRAICKDLQAIKHSWVVLARDTVDKFIGIAFIKDLLCDLAEGKNLDWHKSVRQPLVIHDDTNVLRMMEQFRYSPVQLAIVVDEHGSFAGIVTPADILEAITGDFLYQNKEAAMKGEGLIAQGHAD
ncbi:MAG: membrane protein [Candidatus Tokpelaia sp. JSC085]|nr:MAG: membrane protein [Candidatus Tokpelaia sp. JSC085]